MSEIANIYMLCLAIIILIPAIVLRTRIIVEDKLFKYIRRQLILIILFGLSMIAYFVTLAIGYSNEWVAVGVDSTIFFTANVTMVFIQW